MSKYNRLWTMGLVVGCIVIGFGEVSGLAASKSEIEMSTGFGRAATESDINAWDIDIAPDGKGLPPGRGSVAEGKTVYKHHCASCHGATGVEGPMPMLVGGQGTLNTDHPVKTVGSYWPYATTLYDYIFRTMPFSSPQSLTPDEVYAVVAWILFRNGIVEETARVDATTLPRIQMPNRSNFVSDPRPDVHTKENP